MSNKIPVTSKIELISIIALFSLIIVLRLYHLDADPPANLSSYSTGVYTDPGQYTLFARNYVLTGELNPFHDFRHPVFINSSVTAVAIIIFSLLGTGLWSANFVGFLLSLGSLFFFYLFMRKTAGTISGLLFLLLISVNYNLIFYSKLTFLEHAMSFFAFLALVMISYSQRWYAHVGAGIALAIAIFWGKIIGVVFIAPFACWYGYNVWYQAKRPLTMASLRKGGLFVLGFIVTTAIWYIFVYVPLHQQVTGYFGEQVLYLYGMPKGIASLGGFVHNLLTFGIESELFPRMRTVALLGTVFVGLVLFHATNTRSLKKGFGGLNAGHIFLAVMLVSFYGFLMIWNYRPLRYEIVLIYPFYGAASILISHLWQRRKEPAPRQFPWLFMILSIPLIIVPLYQLVQGVSDSYMWGFSFDEGIYWIIGVSVLLSILIALYITFRPWQQSLRFSLVSKGVTIVIVLVNLILGIYNYYQWQQHITTTARDDSRDLKIVLNEQAVVSGPYSSLLVSENNLQCILHMFGVAYADPDLFKKFPITHLLVDRTNESRARADYPDMMSKAVLVQKYVVGVKDIFLYRISGYTGNPIADSYQLSKFEQAGMVLRNGDTTLARQELLQMINTHPDNISVYMKLAELAEASGENTVAEMYWYKALEYSPTDYTIITGLADCLNKRFLQQKEQQVYDSALVLYDMAIAYAPRDGKLLWKRLSLVNNRLGLLYQGAEDSDEWEPIDPESK